MKEAFTMIELIFAIVIIGILAAVAIPRMSAERDDAKANICLVEFGDIITEVTSSYAKLGYIDFQNLTITAMSNVENSLGSNVGTGIVEVGTALVKDGIIFNCEGNKVATVGFVRLDTSGDYNLTITPNSSPLTPIAISTVILIKKHYKISPIDAFGQIQLAY